MSIDNENDNHFQKISEIINENGIDNHYQKISGNNNENEDENHYQIKKSLGIIMKVKIIIKRKLGKGMRMSLRIISNRISTKKSWA